MIANKKYPVILASLLVISIIFVSCAKKKENTLRNDARELYLKSVDVTSVYIDSIRQAKDSTTLLDLLNRYDHRITNLNYDYPPGADYELAEGENDTLKNLSDRIVYLRDSLLVAYSGKLPTDTIAVESLDSIAQ